MKISKLLNKKNFSITLISLLSITAYAEEKPVDIWNVNEQKIEENSATSKSNEDQNNDIEIKNESKIYTMQSKKKENSIEIENLGRRDSYKQLQ